MHLQFLAKLLWAKDQENTISFLRTAACQGNRKHTSFNIYGQKALGNSLAKGLKDSLVKDSFFSAIRAASWRVQHLGCWEEVLLEKGERSPRQGGYPFSSLCLVPMTKVCSRKKANCFAVFPMKVLYHALTEDWWKWHHSLTQILLGVLSFSIE